MKRSLTVEIAGQRIGLRTDSEEKQVRKIAAGVDARFKAVQKGGRGVDTQQVAILVALQLAEELDRERQALAELKAKVRAKGDALLKLIERNAVV
ncbi:MAG: cell division protein ZapA [Deltaproteobacteria bacterium]|nr:cell division protein ZapA [Deltaproteobacteria bacterium]